MNDPLPGIYQLRLSNFPILVVLGVKINYFHTDHPPLPHSLVPVLTPRHPDLPPCIQIIETTQTKSLLPTPNIPKSHPQNPNQI